MGKNDNFYTIQAIENMILELDSSTESIQKTLLYKTYPLSQKSFPVNVVYLTVFMPESWQEDV
ncbi:MAG: hypothetical protein AAF600_03290 [Bacteroidota bacterium]